MSESGYSYLLFVIIMFLCGYIVGGCVTKSEWEHDAISRGYAHYHPETREFVWEESKND